MSIQTFLTNQNMKLLWDVLMENELFQNKQRDFLFKINTLFNENISDFYEKEKTKSFSLLELNKKFITLFINHIQQLNSKPGNKSNNSKLIFYSIFSKAIFSVSKTACIVDRYSISTSSMWPSTLPIP